MLLTTATRAAFSQGLLGGFFKHLLIVFSGMIIIGLGLRQFSFLVGWILHHPTLLHTHLAPPSTVRVGPDRFFVYQDKKRVGVRVRKNAHCDPRAFGDVGFQGNFPSLTMRCVVPSLT